MWTLHAARPVYHASLAAVRQGLRQTVTPRCSVPRARPPRPCAPLSIGVFSTTALRSVPSKASTPAANNNQPDKQPNQNSNQNSDQKSSDNSNQNSNQQNGQQQPTLNVDVASKAVPEKKQALTDWSILKQLASNVWPKDKPGVKARVLLALSLLVAGKVLNVQVPFFFKNIIDSLNVPLSDNMTVWTVAGASILGCESESCERAECRG